MQQLSLHTCLIMLMYTTQTLAQCPTGTTSVNGTTACVGAESTSCNQGYTGPDGGPCTACDTGKYKVATGDAACTDCASGKYLTTVGATLESTCQACPSNSDSPSASQALTACTCNVGHTGPDGGACTVDRIRQEAELSQGV